MLKVTPVDICKPIPKKILFGSITSYVIYLKLRFVGAHRTELWLLHWRSKKIHHTEAKDGDAINIVTNLITTSNYAENKQKTNLNI